MHDLETRLISRSEPDRWRLLWGRGHHRPGDSLLLYSRLARDTKPGHSVTRTVLSLMLSAALIVCASTVTEADEVSFARDIAPVLKAKCAACHLTGQEAGNLALHPGAAYASLVNVPSRQSKLLQVKPGSPELSYLVLKIEGRHLDAGGTGVPMPLDETTLQRIRAWIAAGAAQN